MNTGSNSLRKLLKLSRLLPDARYRNALRYGVAAAVEHAPLLRTLQCMTVVDVGANVGQFALAARVCSPHANIISFEPLAQPARVFRRIFHDDPRVQLHEVAIGMESGNVTMHVSAKVDSSSLLPIGREQSKLFPGTAERGTEVVRVEPLSAFVSSSSLKAPALLKVDVQGFELQALEGCGELLDQFTFVYAECSFVELYESQPLADEIVAFLRERGVSLQGIHNVTYDATGRAIQGDFLFRRRSTNACGS